MEKKNEISHIQQYVEGRMQGEEKSNLQVKSTQGQKLIDHVENALDYQDIVKQEAKDIMQISSKISGFDVEMSHMSSYLSDFTGQLADISQSNLAIVEETTSTMTQVMDNVGYTSERLDKLTDESKTLIEKNSESRQLLQEVEKLKEEVMADTRLMNDEIMNLVHLVQEIEGIVQSVQEIATQTNLLALNAAIEAARAGEQGKGFAVVADEVGNLAENTQNELDTMKEFVSKVYEASMKGKKSTERTVESTEQMSGKLDTVFVTVGENIDMLGKVAEDVSAINDYMQSIQLATKEVNAAMEQCSQDAEGITDMTVTVNELADDSQKVADGIGQIDDMLTQSTNNLYEGLNMGITMLTNKELVDMLHSVAKAHRDWANKAQLMRDQMKVLPLQLDPKRCAFGHFCNAITLRHPKLAASWEELKGVHNRFHSLGRYLVDAIQKNNENEADKHCREAVELSGEIFRILDRLIDVIETMTRQGEAVF